MGACVRRVRAEAEFGVENGHGARSLAEADGEVTRECAWNRPPSSDPSQNQPSGLLQAVCLSQFGNGWLGELGLENETALMYNGLYLKASFRGSG